LWKAYKAIDRHKHDQHDRHAYRALLHAVTERARAGHDVEFANARTGDTLRLSNPFQNGHVAIAQEDALFSPSTAPFVATYGAADDAHFALLVLQQQNDTSDLSGTWTTWSANFSQDLTDVPAPQAQRLTVSGQIQQDHDQTVTLTVGGSVLT